MEKIPVSGPWITSLEIEYVNDAVRNGWYGNANTYNERFEKAFATYIGRTHAIALPSCTSAIHLSLLGLGVGKGDEVIVPDLTWIASCAPVNYVGATPVFADVDERSWCMSADSFLACITPRTKAVIPVDLYGNIPEMTKLQQICADRGIHLIEDSAEAIGSEYGGKKAGSFGITSVFSFHGSKTLTTGEGGMLVTDDEALYRRILFLRDHGRKPGDKLFFNTEVAFKYKMSALQAALGLAQLERIDELVNRKREIFSWYRDALGDVREITLNSESPHVKNTYWMVTALFDANSTVGKEKILSQLADKGIDCRPFFYPLSSIPAYSETEQAKVARIRNIESYRISPRGINLPSGFNLDRKTVERVATALKEVLNAN